MIFGLISTYIYFIARELSWIKRKALHSFVPLFLPGLPEVSMNLKSKRIPNAQENDSRWILNKAPTGSMGQSCSEVRKG